MNATPKNMARQIRAARAVADARFESGSRLVYTSTTGDPSAVERQEAREAACPKHYIYEVVADCGPWTEGYCECGKWMIHHDPLN